MVQLGKELTEEHKRKIRKAMKRRKGRKHTEATKKKIGKKIKLFWENQRSFK